MRCFSASFILLSLAPAYAASFAERFEEIKRTALQRELYALLFELPKGADLHNHGGLSNIADSWLDLAVKEQRNRFYTLAKFGNRPGDNDLLPRLYTVQRSTWEILPVCLKE